MEASHVRADAPDELIPVNEGFRMAGIGKSKGYEEIRAGRFPRIVKIGAASRLVRSEVRAWIAAKVAERDAEGAAA